jgi:prophage regulatory protein
MVLTQNTDVQILRIKDLTARLGVAKSTIYDWLNSSSPRFKADFPKPIRLGESSVGWIDSEVYDWIRHRARLR